MPSREWDDLDRQVRRALAGTQTEIERRIIQSYARALKEIRAQMGKIYERAADSNGLLTLAQMTQYNRLNTLEKQIAEVMRDNYKIVAKELARLPAQVYQESFFRYAWAIDQQTGVSLSWGVLNTPAIEAAAANPLDLISKDTLSVTMRNRIRTAVSQGLLQGKSYPQMMQGIRAAMGNSAYEAIRIARTEGQRAMSEGTSLLYEKAKASGIKGREIWDATLDGKTRPSHQALDGEPRGEDGFWHVMHEGKMIKTAGPLRSGKASFDINCRCRTRYEIEGYEPIIRRTRDQGIIPYTTYPEWKESLNSRGRYTK